jgi:hypothetical protein
LKRENALIIVLVAIVVIAVVIPTPRLRTEQDLVKTIDCTTTLGDGDSILQGLLNMEDNTKFVIDIVSSGDVDVKIETGKTVLYFSRSKLHAYSFTRPEESFEVSVENPTVWGLGPSVNIEGNIKVYHVYNVTEWLPWWMDARPIVFTP